MVSNGDSKLLMTKTLTPAELHSYKEKNTTLKAFSIVKAWGVYVCSRLQLLFKEEYSLSYLKGLVKCKSRLKTTCNDMNTAFPPALRRSAMMPQIPRALPLFQLGHCSLCFHKRRWTTVDRSVSNRDCNTPDIQLDSWWISLVLLCQEPTTLCSNCSSPRDGLG